VDHEQVVEKTLADEDRRVQDIVNFGGIILYNRYYVDIEKVRSGYCECANGGR
jgi:hypothetical protein